MILRFSNSEVPALEHLLWSWRRQWGPQRQHKCVPCPSGIVDAVAKKQETSPLFALKMINRSMKI
jgi:hypothetical protein